MSCCCRSSAASMSRSPFGRRGSGFASLLFLAMWRLCCRAPPRRKNWAQRLSETSLIADRPVQANGAGKSARCKTKGRPGCPACLMSVEAELAYCAGCAGCSAGRSPAAFGDFMSGTDLPMRFVGGCSPSPLAAPDDDSLDEASFGPFIGGTSLSRRLVGGCTVPCCLVESAAGGASCASAGIARPSTMLETIIRYFMEVLLCVPFSIEGILRLANGQPARSLRDLTNV